MESAWLIMLEGVAAWALGYDLLSRCTSPCCPLLPLPHAMVHRSSHCSCAVAPNHCNHPPLLSTSRTVELYDPRRDAWAAGPVMPAPASFAAAAMLGGQVYVVEGTAHAPHVLSLERHKRLWGACQPLAKPRVNMAVCALEDRLYVLVRD